MTHASLCTGIGACELAADWMGWDNAFSCEISTFCQRTLKYYHPKSKLYENIFGTDFSEWRGRIDILTAGFPCQPFSVAGSRKGAEDDRYLWPEVLRAIGEIRPAWFLGENVAGILSMVLPGDEVAVGSYKDALGESYQDTEMRQQFVVDRIFDDLEDIGYSVQPIIIPACACGAPHRRDRIWFIANANDDGPLDPKIGQGNRKGNDNNKAGTDKAEQPEGCRRASIASDTTGEGLPQRFGDGIREDEKESQARLDNKPERHGNKRIAPNADKPGGFWEQFPTQPAVCCGDDGIPDRLSDITVSRWRTESIKAFGNSMVPQVVYEIFRAIEHTEKAFTF